MLVWFSFLSLKSVLLNSKLKISKPFIIQITLDYNYNIKYWSPRIYKFTDVKDMHLSLPFVFFLKRMPLIKLPTRKGLLLLLLLLQLMTWVVSRRHCMTFKRKRRKRLKVLCTCKCMWKHLSISPELNAPIILTSRQPVLCMGTYLFMW